MNPTSPQQLHKLVQQVRASALQLQTLTTAQKNRVLATWAKDLKKNSVLIFRANARDVSAAQKNGVSPALLDRLVLNPQRLQEVIAGLMAVRKLPDPVGEVVESSKRNGLRISRVRIPLGVICMIYESRPNVTVDAAALCLKSGNAVILRGGSEALQTNTVLVKILRQSLQRLPGKTKALQNAVVMLPNTDRQTLATLLSLRDGIDLVIPRGGSQLMQFIHEHAKVPVIKHDKGVCSLFVDASADLPKSVRVVLNAKTQRPGVCNALETLYVHKKIAKEFLTLLLPELAKVPCEVRADATLKKQFPKVQLATTTDWSEEYLAQILAIKTVADVDDAIAHVQKYSSHHTDGILTQNPKNIQKYLNSLDASCVMINTSTRFNDGGELGLGAEIGISTTKLHAYGPMGLKELTAVRFEVQSDYKIR